MLHVSTGALVSLVFIMLICFVLPIALFTLLYRFADGRIKTLLIGAAAYLACGVILDTVLASTVDMMGKLNTNGALYLFYTALLSPASFLILNYLIIRRFGANSIKTTGDSMMYSLGYSGAFNILSTGIIAIMYFLALLDIRNRGGNYLIVSDADYVSASETVSASNIVNESIYNDMVRLCSEPVSYYMTFVINCLWAVAAYAAVILVIWLASKKTEKLILLAFAYVIRLFITLPDILNHFGLTDNQWLSHLISAIVLVIVWAAALFCRKTFIDSEDAVQEEKA